MNILERANEIINCRSEEKDRQYGPMGEGMEIAAKIFNLITPEGQSITPEGMYWALVALKLSRQHYNHKEDNLLDAVAYIGALNNYIESKDCRPETPIGSEPELIARITAPTDPSIILTNEKLNAVLNESGDKVDNYKPQSVIC